ncbi:NADPH-dependent 7-cyano-7-deazaguanine reductase [Liberibacter crescens BT-1]|uniref:NADPH-dependent 7-cyano-7-deazaguanine reductase n=1 Tax=Liberibacter crescens (strain BT-1) TaxID=1215343 RepID=L0EW63_LIBCB|nr:preQ(1) synthase [Liberibacter crescens]AGA65075.1 NADPH-dependent 7-cyano-7-deazaguanine reductase [Liberibacter crescens BT-1]AMC13063.1 7-cyano-7-deazaguanine reductase [Liberibacter crescens]
MHKKDTPSLSILGEKTTFSDSPETALLEKIPSTYKELCYVVRFTAPEFTSLCPVTSQPDFAYIIIDYVPNKWLVESKSFKLFLTSFRNHRAFHEDCSLYIAQRLVTLLEPQWLRICAYWYPRGGIPIDVFWQTSSPPKGALIPDPGVPTYRGRG